MRRAVARTLLATALTAVLVAPSGAQTLPDPVLPGGRLRLGAMGWFEHADERWLTGGESEPLGASLTRPSAGDLFPGAAQLRPALAEALGYGSGEFPLRLGASAAVIATNRIQVPLTVDVGVFDWLTVGATVPLEKHRVEGTLEIAGDEDADLGVNPATVNLPLVQGFIAALSDGAQAAALLADQRCGADPGSAGCVDAQALAEDLESATTAFTNLYGTSALFPAAETEAGQALVSRAQALSDRLTAEGLAGLGTTPPLAGTPLERATLEAFLIDQAGPYAYLAPVGSVGGVWGVGDVEARVAIRLLEGHTTDSAGAPAGVRWRLAATGTVRLPTGAGPEPNAVFLPGQGDGQLDLEAGAYAALSTRRFAVRTRARWVLQQPGEIVDRVRPPELPLVSRSSLATLEHDPGEILEVEVQPAFRIAPALSIGAVWRYFTKTPDTYARVSPLPAAPADPLIPRGAVFTDPSVMGVNTQWTLQEAGGSITYRNTGLPDAGGEGFEVFFDARTSLSGDDGAPKGWRASVGARIMRRLWGN